MEMDIPDPDELEWLEANSHLYEDFEPPIEEEEEQQPYFEEEEPVQPQSELEPESQPHFQIPTKQTLVIPPKPAPITLNINGKKRFRSDVGGPPEAAGDESSGDKRSRVECPEVEVEEDWLRYSPPPPPPPPDEVEVIEEKFISRFASEIDGDCIPITGPDGERVYAKMNMVETEERFSKLDIERHGKGLIPESITALMEKVEQDAFEKALQDSVQCHSDVILHDVPVVNEQLWVDKYAPNSFMELLSDEQTNREVLMWLKQWDSCVFGTDIKSTTEDVLSSLRRHTSVVQNHKVSTKSSYFGKNKESRFGNYNSKVHGTSNLDQGNNDSKSIQDLWNKRKVSGPPEQKILLLCGPPGLGKTTLAHVAARHCGYRVMEINASDDRSSSTIESKILDVVQMNSVIGDSKPKCLVIDEIDGALGDGKGAVEVILKMVSADKKAATSGKENSGHEEHSGKASSKKKRKDTSLLRPVICICNDLYAPALRQLRQVAKVHIFVQPTVSRIVTRLKFICNKEGLKTSSIALTALAEYTDCDIRSCLNTLQFLNKKKENLSVLEISSQVVGRKDTAKTLFDVWKEIFQKKKLKRDRKPVSRGSVLLNEFELLHSLISNRGDYDLIMDGIHENMLLLNYHDPMMRKTTTCSHNLGDSDIFHNYIMRTQKMSLLAYQPGIAIGIHGIIAQHEKPNIEWPKSFQRYRTTLIEKVDTLRSWQNKISPYISRHISTRSFVEDTISPLLHILSPPTLRPVASHILSEKEKKDLDELVCTMVSYSITYKNIKSDPLPATSFKRHESFADVSILGFDPPLGDFINFKDYDSCHFVLTMAVKQVLTHEVEKQRIRQNSINRSMQPSDDVSNKENKVLESKAEPSEAERTSESATNKKIPFSFLKPQTNSPTATSSKGSIVAAKQKPSECKKKPSSKPINFFERFKKVSINGSQISEEVVEITATMKRDLRPLLFKFNEGFTNAVKRPVRMREFLL